MDLRISSPCPTTWERMPGSDRVRYCSLCRLNVYNLVAMSREEVAALLRNTRGRLCARLYVRRDRTATLEDCPQGSARRKLRRVLALVGVLVLGTLGWLLRIPGDQDRSVHPRWVRNVLEWVDPQPRGVPMVGSLCPPPASRQNPLSGTSQ